MIVGPQLDALRYALAEEDELIVNALDRLSARELSTFYSVLTTLHDTVRSQMKARGVAIPVRMTFSRDSAEDATAEVVKSFRRSRARGMDWRRGEVARALHRLDAAYPKEQA